MTLSPLKSLFLAALLWLPMAFFLWFYFATVVVWPTVQLAGPLLVAVLPDIFVSVGPDQFALDIRTRLLADMTQTGGRVALLDLTINPMIYGFGLPLLAGLTMATPLSGTRRFAQISLGFVVITAVMLWGVFWQALKIVRFDVGPQGVAALEGTIFIEPVIGLCYQFGYLILPAVTPIALWILCNRRFLETVVGDNFFAGTRRRKVGQNKATAGKAPEDE